jgi:hypothetical protein
MGKGVIRALPQTGTAEIVIKEDLFKMIETGAINKLDVDIIIFLEGKRKVKISATITKVFSPGRILHDAKTKTMESTLSDIDTAWGFGRSMEVLTSKLSLQSWFLFAKTKGNGNREICIVLHPHVGTSFSFKKDGEMGWSTNLN